MAGFAMGNILKVAFRTRTEDKVWELKERRQLDPSQWRHYEPRGQMWRAPGAADKEDFWGSSGKKSEWYSTGLKRMM
jgi:hypothetical protein